MVKIVCEKGTKETMSMKVSGHETMDFVHEGGFTVEIDGIAGMLVKMLIIARHFNRIEHKDAVKRIEELNNKAVKKAA